MSEIRIADAADLVQLDDLERAADTLFTAAGIGPLPPARRPTVVDQSLFVLVGGDPPVGFAKVDSVDGNAHLAALAVHPDWGHRGMGSAVLEAATTFASAQVSGVMTLITFRDVPWNAPFYARHGFREIPPTAPRLLALRAAEVDGGLDRLGTRIVMARRLSAVPPSAPR